MSYVECAKADVETVGMKEYLAVFGYIHHHINLINHKYNTNLIFPDGIILIAILYLQPYFEWDPAKCANVFKFSNDNTILKYEGRYNRTIVSKNIISSKKYNRVEWELKLTDFGYICIAFGFIEYPMSKSIRNIETTENFLSKPYQYSVYIYHDGSNDAFEICNAHKIIQKVTKIMPSDIIAGDKLKLIFDFTKMQCSFHFNGEFVGILAENLKHDIKYIPAMAVCRPHTIECTQWLLHSKGHK